MTAMESTRDPWTRTMANKASIFRFADVEVREREFSLTKARESFPVEPNAFRVLLILLRNNPG